MFESYRKNRYPTFINNWKIIIYISSFVFLFMLIFEPFGLNQIEGNKVLIYLGYGLVSFIALAISNILFPNIFHQFYDKNHWNNRKFILWNLSMILLIGVLNFLYGETITDRDYGLHEFLIFLLNTFAIGIFPLTILTLIRNRNSKISEIKNEFIQNSNAEAPEIIEFEIENSKTQYSVDTRNLLYIESRGNYLLFFKCENEAVKEYKIRGTMNKVESLIAESKKLMKCHRSFIVNTDFIENTQGSSKKLNLKLRYLNHEIPVSRNYTATIKTLNNKI